MDLFAAKRFVAEQARPLDGAVYRYFFENGTKESVITALSAFQNADGGFGHALEPDCFNPNSSPIATNDAILTLARIDALQDAPEMIDGIVRYLLCGDSFDRKKQRWLFAIESNHDYPHAIWWEKTDDGIHGFNPTMSLAAFLWCCTRNEHCAEILNEGLHALEADEEVNGEALSCYLLAEHLLTNYSTLAPFELAHLRAGIAARLEETICAETEKYGVEYVPVPSDFFAGRNQSFLTPELRRLAIAEAEVLDGLQRADGGFDITWQWGTPYPAEFAQARAWWRPRITLDKLLFLKTLGIE